VASKFIIFQTPEGEQAVIFPREYFFHDEMASRFPNYEVQSAGFVQIIENGQVHCFGRSDSLNIDSRGEDDDIVISRQIIKRSDE
jgi:hypothetical protein